MEFSLAIRELFIGDAKIFLWSYRVVAVCIGIALSGIILDVILKKKYKRRSRRIYKNKTAMGILSILITAVFISGFYYVVEQIFIVEPTEIVKTNIGKIYLDEEEAEEALETLRPVTVSKVIDDSYAQVLSRNGIYSPESEVVTERPYYEIEKWEATGMGLGNPLYVIVEKGVLQK